MAPNSVKCFLLFCMLGGLGLSCGCSRSASWLDARDSADQLMRRARAKQNEGDMPGAIGLYRKALNSNRRMARAHLDLALLLHHEERDYLGAVCHYRRYLEMRSTTEKREMIANRMRRALQSFASDLAEKNAAASGGEREVSPDLMESLQRLRRAQEAEKRLAARVAELEQDNRDLRSTVGRLEAEIDHERALTPATRRTSTGAAARGGRRTEVQRTYRVRRGDSLSSIAVDVYNDSARWRDILDANREQLGNSPEIRVGQVLVIP